MLTKRAVGIMFCAVWGAGVVWADVSFKAGASMGTTLGGMDNTVLGSLPTGGDLETHKALYGLQAVAQFTPRFSVELAGERMTDMDWEERLGISMTTGDIRFYPVTLTARYSFPCFQDAFRVYCLAGVGEYFFDDIDIAITGTENAPGLVTVGSHPKISVDNAFGYHLGLGLEWPIFRNLEFFSEFRFAVTAPRAHLSGVTAQNAQGQSVLDAFEYDITDNRDIGSARVGLNYVF